MNKLNVVYPYGRILSDNKHNEANKHLTTWLIPGNIILSQKTIPKRLHIYEPFMHNVVNEQIQRPRVD